MRFFHLARRCFFWALILSSVPALSARAQEAAGEEIRPTAASTGAAMAAPELAQESTDAPYQGIRQGFMLGLGTISQNMGKIGYNAKGQRSITGENYFPELVFGWRADSVFPTLGWTPFGKRALDGAKRHSLITFSLPFVFAKAERALEWKLGAGLQVYRVHGPGGPVVLRNGNSTSTFYVPSPNRFSVTYFLLAGAGIRLGDGGFRLDGDFTFGGLLSRRRALGLMIRGGYVF